MTKADVFLIAGMILAAPHLSERAAKNFGWVFCAMMAIEIGVLDLARAFWRGLVGP